MKFVAKNSSCMAEAHDLKWRTQKNENKIINNNNAHQASTVIVPTIRNVWLIFHTDMGLKPRAKPKSKPKPKQQHSSSAFYLIAHIFRFISKLFRNTRRQINATHLHERALNEIITTVNERKQPNHFKWKGNFTFFLVMRNMFIWLRHFLEQNSQYQNRI